MSLPHIPPSTKEANIAIYTYVKINASTESTKFIENATRKIPINTKIAISDQKYDHQKR
jgi:hypothetical protein